VYTGAGTGLSVGCISADKVRGEGGRRRAPGSMIKGLRGREKATREEEREEERQTVGRRKKDTRGGVKRARGEREKETGEKPNLAAESVSLLDIFLFAFMSARRSERDKA